MSETIGIDSHTFPVELNLTSNTQVTLQHSRAALILPRNFTPNRSGFDTTDPPSVVNYDVSLLSRGAPTPFNAFIDYRTVEIPTDIDQDNPLTINPFFTNVLPSLRQIVVPRETSGDKVYYDIFHSAGGSGTGSVPLTVFTIEDPPGKFPTLPTGDAIPSAVIHRSTNGKSFYDVFYF